MKIFSYLFISTRQIYIYTRNVVSVNLKIWLVDNVTVSVKTWACTSVYDLPLHDFTQHVNQSFTFTCTKLVWANDV
jgi:hypothetical protein